MIFWSRSGRPGPVVGIAAGVHGDERPPIAALQALAASLEQAPVDRGAVLLMVGNPAAVALGQRWSERDLNRCFHPARLASPPATAEDRRARELVAACARVDVLVDFHCTAEPGEPFAMHHPIDDAHQAVTALLDVPVVVRDPRLCFGGVSLDEHLSTTQRVGVCCETGWIGAPDNTPDRILAQMRNVLRGLGVRTDAPPVRAPDKRVLTLTEVLRCPARGFAWAPGVGHNLQRLPAGAALGRRGDGTPLLLSAPATLIFPKKRPALLQPGRPLVYLAEESAAP